MPEQKKTAVPRLRFPEFRNAGPWEVKRLGNVANIAMGASPKSSSYNNEQVGLPLLQGNADIKDRTSCPRLFTSQITRECHIGDILLSVRAPVGMVAKSVHHACIGRGIAAIRVKGENWQEFLYQWLLWFEPHWESISQGGTFDSVNRDDIRNLSAVFPKLPEQQKIADCLSSLDDLIQAEAARLEALQAHKKGLMQQLFPREGETTPRLRFPEFRDAGPWEVKQLGETARLRNGYAFKSSTYTDDGVYQIITIANVQEGMLSLESTKRIASLPNDIQQHQILKPGDILISMTGNVGRVCRVTTEALLLNQRVGKLEPKKNINAEFLYQWLQRPAFRKAMELRAAGGAQGNLSSGDITGSPVYIPKSATEQQKIADCLSSLDDLTRALGKHIEALKQHKKGLMQQLFPQEVG